MNTIKQITTERSRSTPEGWVETTLENVVSKLGDGLHGTPQYNDDGEYYFINGNNLSEGRIEIKPETKRCNKVEYEKYKKDLNDRTILVSINGSLGYFAYYNNEKCFLGKSACYFNVKENVSKEFVGYQIRSKYFQKYIERLAGGTTIKNVSLKTMREFPFAIPQNLPEQKAIAAILTAFDDKIKLLQAQNKTLEETAQTIFKEWFGKYQIGDELPDGWRIFQLSELVVTINGYSYKGSELVEKSDDALVTLKSFDRNGGFQTRGFKPFLGNPKANQEVEIGDLIVAHTDLTQDADVLGNPAFIFDDGGFKKMYITMDLVKVLPIHKDISSSFLYYLMKDKAFKGHCVGYSNGTTVLHLSKKAISEYQLFLPIDFNLIKRFSELADSTTTKISLNKITIKSLYETRDELLPRLMSGEIRVNDFKEHVA